LPPKPALQGDGPAAGAAPGSVRTQLWAPIRKWLNAAAFSLNAVRREKRYGNLGYNALIGPSAFTIDAGLHKSFL